MFIYIYIVVYKGGRLNVPVCWKDEEEMILSRILRSQIFHMFGQNFYFPFKLEILTAYYHYMKQTYCFDDETIFNSGEMNRVFILK
jgi:hypothetical protein